MAFVDGEPIDAAKLGELEAKVNDLSKAIPKIGVSTTKVSVSGNSTVDQNSGAPEIQAGSSDKWIIKPGPNSKQIKFRESFTGTPRIIISTRMSSGTVAWHPQVSVAYGADKSGFLATVFMPSNAPSHSIFVDYIAIAY